MAPAEGSRPPRIITLDLLRKRAEHNEGLVSSLEELSLHQEELQSIGPILGRTCGRTLRILLLQNNVIARMDPTELKLFRSLEYLNLALNNVTKIEGVGGMEWLRKLDLTLNFIDVDALEDSVDELAKCRSLEELFFLGNPCMGVAGGVPGAEGDNTHATQIGWEGCRPYIVARLPNLQFLDGREVKRSERIVATQKLPALTAELHSLAEARRKVRQEQQHLESGDAVDDEVYISDEAPTHHNPQTRTKLSNELHDQKRAKEKQEGANQPPQPKGEKEWEAEHKDAVQKAREREERGRERECGDGAEMRTDGGIKQCNQGKYRFWFEEETSKGADGKRKGNLILRVAVPKHLSTSLIDVDIHPTYASVVIKSKILRVILPVEVLSDRSSARRSAASGYLELVMPKADPNDVAIGSGHVRDRAAATEIERDAKGGKTKRKEEPKRRERLGESMLKEAGRADPLNIVQREIIDSQLFADDDDNDDDGPPPLH
ncbi:hypothetical protein ACHAXT_002288 [Thalassiosira profunda]